MEATKEEMSLLHKITPPKLEDAGLEDCALPLHSIHEAFLKAASAVAGTSRAVDNDDDVPPHDELIGITPEVGPPSGACTTVKGGAWDASGDLVVGGRNEDDVKKTDDVVVIGGGDGGERSGCVDEIRDLGIKETGNGGGGDDGDEEDKKKPTLIEGFFFNP